MGIFSNDCDLKGIGIFYDGSTIEIPCESVTYSYMIGHGMSTYISLQYNGFINGKELRSLKVPEGVHNVVCTGHKLLSLSLPDSVILLRCDKEVKGLEKYIDKIQEITLI